MTAQSSNHSAPGAILCAPGTIIINANRPTIDITVSNHGDRPIQVGSHYHFFEVNPALNFDREATYGFRLDIPAGTAVRFEPGDTKDITLVSIGGDRIIYGLHGLVQGPLDSAEAKEEAMQRLAVYGFLSTS